MTFLDPSGSSFNRKYPGLSHVDPASASGRNESLSFFDAKLHETGAPMGCHMLSQADELHKKRSGVAQGVRS